MALHKLMHVQTDACTHMHIHHTTHLYNSINRTGFLTKATVDTFGHVDIISGCPTAPILPLLSFNSDRLSTSTSIKKTSTMQGVQYHRDHTS